MSKHHCYLCGETVDHFNWKHKGGGWMCGKHFKSGRAIEWIPDRIKEDRRAYSKEIVQPFRDSEPSREYIDLYGHKNMNITEKEAKKAKRVWTDTVGWRTGDAQNKYTK